MAVSSLGQLTVDLVANTAGFERGMDQAERALQRTTKEAKYQGDQLERLLGKIDPTTAAYARLDKMEQQLDAHRKAGRLPTDDYVEYIAKINAAREAISRTDSVLAKSGVSAKQTAAAFRILPAQLSDIATQLAGGQNPLLILLQQGSQIKDSFGGIGATFDAFGAKVKGLFTGSSGLTDLAAGAIAVGEGANLAGEGLGSMAEGANTAADASKNAAEAAEVLRTASSGVGVSMGLIVAGVVAAAAAIAALIIAYKQGSDEATAYNKALALTGNTAGTSVSELSQLAQAVASVNGTVHEAAATLALLAGSTKIPVESFREIAVAAANMEDATGKAASETVSEFAKIAADPVSAVLKLNESMNFLTASVYSQIKALQEAGRVQEAAAVGTSAYADAINTRTPKIVENLGLIERGWKNLGDAAKIAWDTALGIGRNTDTGPNVEKLRQRLAYQKSILGTESEGSDTQGLIDDLTKQIAAVEKLNNAEKEANRTQGESQQLQQQSIADQIQLDKLRTETQSKAEKRTKELAAYQDLVARRQLESEKLNDKALVISAEQQAKDIAAINEKYKDAKTPKPAAVSEDAGQKLLGTLREQAAALQLQSDSIDEQTGKYKTLGAQAKALAEFEQRIANIKSSDIQTADQKSILASEDLLRAQLKRNVAIEAEIAARKTSYEEAAKLQAFQENQASKLQGAQEGLDSQLTGLGSGEKLRERLKEDLSIRKDYQSELDKLNKQFNTGAISEDLHTQETELLGEALVARLVMQQDYYNQVDEASKNLFIGLSESWNDYLTQATDVSAQTKTLFDGAFGGLTDALYGFVTTGKLSFQDLAASFAQTALKMLIQYAAAQAIAAGLNAFTSTAAIPIVGPLAAPAAAASALAYAGGLSASIAGIAGMAHDGIDSVPQTGTWLLQKGERVTTAQTSAKLDKTLNDIKSPTGTGNTTLNLIEDASRAGQSEERTGDQGEKMIDVFVADLLGDGRTADAMNRKFGLQTAGR